jgi:hypothetical protein
VIVFNSILRHIICIFASGHTFVMCSHGIIAVVSGVSTLTTTSGATNILRLHQNPNKKQTE